MKTKVMKSLLAAVMFSAILNACSSSTAPSKSASGSEEVIQVATGQSMAPFCYLDVDGNLVGYDIDVLLDENVTIRSSSAVASNITKVEIITRRSVFEKLKKALDAIGVSGMTVSEVMGVWYAERCCRILSWCTDGKLPAGEDPY